MTHPELQAALARVNITIDAAEAHGWLAGSLCVRPDYGAAQWVADLAADAGGAPPAAGETLAGLVEATRSALGSDGFEFEPLLPADDAPLADRVAALAAWAGGFLYGVGTGAPRKAAKPAGDVAEFLGDLAEIARARLEPGREAEAAERDLVELVEFVRAGAQLAFDELAGARADAPG